MIIIPSCSNPANAERASTETLFMTAPFPPDKILTHGRTHNLTGAKVDQPGWCMEMIGSARVGCG